VRVLFHANTLNYRGTTVAITDYAHYNQEILGNESVIAYCKTYGEEKDMGNESAVIEALEKKFKVVGYRAGNLENKIDDNKIDLAYFIAGGEKSSLPTNCKTGVHAVFQYNDPHGDRYAYISKWLSDEMSQGQIPYVPHIVNLPTPKTNYRKVLGIRDDQIVVGRIGGYYTFDIPGIKEYVKKLVTNNDTFVFLFVGTEPFVNHPNVKFINEIHNPQKKADFIDTCDCMLHARHRGESFGLSIAEFLSLNKPVLAWNGGHDRNHLEMLKNSNTLYNDENDLNYMLHNLGDFKEDWAARVKEYNPDNVMKKFNEVFLC
jgi:glycosyltransferase involved in cell wall biosynthesis